MCRILRSGAVSSANAALSATCVWSRRFFALLGRSEPKSLQGEREHLAMLLRDGWITRDEMRCAADLLELE